MLRRIDRAFAAVTWLVAAILVVMLLFGPALVAHDNASGKAGASPYGSSSSGSGGANGKALFASNCGSCHTLSAAGTNGQVGPNLDQVSLSEQQIAAQIRHGGGGMPAFAGQLSDAQIDAIADFVAKSESK